MAFYDHLAVQQQQPPQQQQQQKHLPLQPQPQPQPQPSYGNDMRTTLWMGELEPWMDENWIRSAWYSAGEQVNIKMIRDKFTGANAGYCFVELSSPMAAAKAVSTLNGVLIPGTNKAFKLNWASGGGMHNNGPGGNQEFSVFVGDLSPEVTEYMLVSKFQERYLSCRSAKIMTDPTTGYGFVRFGDESEQLRALHEMQGVYVGSRPIRISMATPKNKMANHNNNNNNNHPHNLGHSSINGGAVSMAMSPSYGFNNTPMQSSSPQHNMNHQYNDPNNTTVFVGGLSGVAHEEELRNCFSMFGEITYVKIPPGKGCGFVQFVHRQSAEMAINQMNGFQIGNSRVRLSWGRAQSENKQPMSPHGAMMNHAAAFRPPMQQAPLLSQPIRPSPPAYGSYPGMMAATPPMLGLLNPQSPRDPLERLPVDNQNRGYLERKEPIMERMDNSVNWRGSGAIYA
ncbi:tRNA selenocysteine 1-associated protein 1 [Actinomortierella wolfii]|nr:tRNA selenocysteine 1-associated protein 1 [Actinomortierella wolfii]